MSAITCPVCEREGEPAASVAGIDVCRFCGASLRVDGDEVRRATAAETTALSAAELQTLRAARGRIARPGR